MTKKTTTTEAKVDEARTVELEEKELDRIQGGDSVWIDLGYPVESTKPEDDSTVSVDPSAPRVTSRTR